MTYRDPQYLFGKISTSLTNTISIERTSRNFDTSYALSKWPHLHRAYVISGCISIWLAVCSSILKLLQFLWSFRSKEKPEHHLKSIDCQKPSVIQFLELFLLENWGLDIQHLPKHSTPWIHLHLFHACLLWRSIAINFGNCANTIILNFSTSFDCFFKLLITCYLWKLDMIYLIFQGKLPQVKRIA